MVHIKFTACPRTSVVSPKFVPMASKDAAKVSMERSETSAKQPEESLADEQMVISMEVASEQGPGFDQENQSKGSSDSETTSHNCEHIKIGAATTLAGISYDFGQSTIMKAHLASLESFAHYFPCGYGRLPGIESILDPRENEAVVFEDSFVAGLHMIFCASSECNCISTDTICYRSN
jgi:hypothetical protein